MQNEDSGNAHARAGISSYAFRYAFGGEMDSRDFVEKASALGFSIAQLCENTDASRLSSECLTELAERASAAGIGLELGFKGLSAKNLDMHIEASRVLGCSVLRIVLSEIKPETEEAAARLENETYRIIESRQADLREAGLRIGIENHFDLPTERLVVLADAFGRDTVGLILDTSNCLGFLEPPEHTLDLMRDRIISIHLKDFRIRKLNTGYSIMGTELGEGQLNLKEFIARVSRLSAAPDLFLELSLAPDGVFSAEQVLEWERGAVERNSRRLFKLRKLMDKSITGPGALRSGSESLIDEKEEFER